MSKAGMVQTVIGPVPSTDLGHTQTHEHLLSDLSPIVSRVGVVSAASSDVPTDFGRLSGEEFPATTRKLVAEPISLKNYDWVRRHVLNWDNLRLLDEQDAIEEMHLYRSAGGGTIVEATSVGLGRDPRGLARISRATGVHIVMGAGYYVRDFHPPELETWPEDKIRDEIVRDVLEGVGDSDIRSGLIGEIGLSSPMHPVEARVLRAAAKAQVITGAPLSIHPGRSQGAPMEAIRIVEECGGAPDRTIMGHIDRTLFSLDDMVELATRGCYLEFDMFGQESSYYAFASIDQPNDASRLDYIAELIEKGFIDQLVVSQDICQKVHMRKYGGPGYTHIIENVLPVMRRKGFEQKEIDRVTIQNPGTILTLQKG